jgi:hypothetical protein
VELRGVLTREEFVPNERIVDHSSMGPVFTYDFAPDASGTTLTLAYSISSRAPLVAEFRDAVLLRFGDDEVHEMLGRIKAAIEGSGTTPRSSRSPPLPSPLRGVSSEGTPGTPPT